MSLALQRRFSLFLRLSHLALMSHKTYRSAAALVVVCAAPTKGPARRGGHLMQVEFLANLRNSADGKYINGITVEPEPGISFGFSPETAGQFPNGKYHITGVLTERPTRNGKMLSVRGIAVPVTLTYAPTNGAAAPAAGARK